MNSANIKDLPIADLPELSPRVKRILHSYSIATLAGLSEYRKAQITRIRNVGKESIKELAQIMSAAGVAFKGETEPPYELAGAAFTLLNQRFKMELQAASVRTEESIGALIDKRLQDFYTLITKTLSPKE